MKIYVFLLPVFLGFSIDAMDNKKMFCNYTHEKAINVTRYTAICISGIGPYYGVPNPRCRHVQTPVHPKTLIPTTVHRFYCPTGQLPIIQKSKELL